MDDKAPDKPVLLFLQYLSTGGCGWSVGAGGWRLEAGGVIAECNT